MTSSASGLKVSRIPGGVNLWVHVTPRASRPGVGGSRGDALRVAVSAPPVAGRANAACVRVLAEALGVRAGDVEVDPGSRGRRKRVRVHGDAQRLEQRLRDLAGGTPSR